jgi:hypothetical protein
VTLAAGLAARSAAEPSLFYSKTFPGSQPAYVEIHLTVNGAGEYREDAQDEQPLKFALAPAEIATMMGLASKLENFQVGLESGLKVAKTGDKIFRWMDGPAVHEQKFNYSTNPDAQALLGWFERIADTERSYIELERTVKYDRLGVNQALLGIQTLIEKKRLVAGEQFLPFLDRVSKNKAFLNMARDRANEISTRIRAAQLPAATTQEGAQ